MTRATRFPRWPVALVMAAGLAISASAQDEAPAPEQVTGSVDLGYRFVTDVAGSGTAYRSIVNLGEGPKLLGADFSLNDPTQRLFDLLTVRGAGWGGDPYTTAQVEVSKDRLYRFQYDHRRTAYFNALPSFANPFSGDGFLLNQRAFDTDRRLDHAGLELFPGRRFVPYLDYSRNSENGRGVTSFVTASNEYPVANQLRSHTDQYRGGVRMRFQRFQINLEEGAAIFKDDQSVWNSTLNQGNLNRLRANPLLGQTLSLTDLLQSYGIRGRAPYTRASVSGSPARWLQLDGQFVYSMGTTEADYRQFNTGQFADLRPLLFFTSQRDIATGTARQPHTSASIGASARPLRRLRIVNNWTTDRLHTASSQAIDRTLAEAAGGAVASAQLATADRLVDNYSQNSLDVLFDLLPNLTLRGGHRYVWGDTTVRTPTYLSSPPAKAHLARQSGVAGASYRAGFGLSANLEFEAGSADDAYYRTSLRDFRKLRAHVRQRVLKSLSIAWDLSTLDNDNPAAGVDFQFESRSNTLSVEWLPGDRISLLADYSRTSVASDIDYLIPQEFQTDHIPYRENAHQASLQLGVTLPAIGGRAARITAGGSLFASSGSRPTHLYRPLAGLSVPLARGVAWVSEWRWYGFDEPFYLYENFRVHQFTTGFRLTR